MCAPACRQHTAADPAAQQDAPPEPAGAADARPGGDLAEQILWAADHAPRELLIGQPTYKAVWAQKFIPGLLDHYLGRNGWDSQFVDKPNEQTDDILFHTIPGDPGAHGPYQDREQGADAATWLSTHPKIALGGAGALVAGTAELVRNND